MNVLKRTKSSGKKTKPYDYKNVETIKRMVSIYRVYKLSIRSIISENVWMLLRRRYESDLFNVLLEDIAIAMILQSTLIFMNGKQTTWT
jgi:hypothetical protein